MTQPAAQVGAHFHALLIGRLDCYDEVENIRNYIERLDLYFQANETVQGKQTAVVKCCRPQCLQNR